MSVERFHSRPRFVLVTESQLCNWSGVEDGVVLHVRAPMIELEDPCR